MKVDPPAEYFLVALLEAAFPVGVFPDFHEVAHERERYAVRPGVERAGAGHAPEVVQMVVDFRFNPFEAGLHKRHKVKMGHEEDREVLLGIIAIVRYDSRHRPDQAPTVVSGRSQW